MSPSISLLGRSCGWEHTSSLPRQPQRYDPRILNTFCGYNRVISSFLLFVLQVSLRLRRRVLPPAWPGGWDFGERHCPHHHSLHSGALRSHLSSLPLPHHVQAVEGGQTHPCHMGRCSRLCHTSGTPRYNIWRTQEKRGILIYLVNEFPPLILLQK